MTDLEISALLAEKLFGIATEWEPEWSNDPGAPVVPFAVGDAGNSYGLWEGEPVTWLSVSGEGMLLVMERMRELGWQTSHNQADGLSHWLFRKGTELFSEMAKMTLMSWPLQHLGLWGRKFRADVVEWQTR